MLQRSVQRLTLLLPVEEQDEALEVTDSVVSRVLDGSISRGQPTNPARGHPTIPARGSRCGQADEIDLDNLPENQDEDGDSPETDGLAEKEDSGINSETRIESILSPTAAIFYPRIVLCREPEEIGTMNAGNLQEITPKDEGTTASSGIAALETKAKRGRPKKGTRVPERRSERVWKGQN